MESHDRRWFTGTPLKPKMLGCNGVNCEKTREPDPLLSWVIRMNRLVGRRRLNPAPPFGGTEWHTLGRAYELPHLPELKIRIHQLRSDTSRGRRTANRFCSSASWRRNDAQLHSPSTRALEIEWRRKYRDRWTSQTSPVCRFRSCPRRRRVPISGDDGCLARTS